MSDYEVKGRLIVKNDQKEVGNNGFIIREFVVQTNSQYPQSIPMQLVKDGCALLDQYQIGQEITAHVNLNGREYDKKDGSGKGYFLSLSAWKIEANGTAQAPQAPAAAPSARGENKEDDLPF